jgi:hypothetical protein
MSTVWFGVKIGAGILLGIVAASIAAIVVWRVFNEIRVLAFARQFVRAGFTWEENQNVRGWLTRDPHNEDWILWDEQHARMLRSSDGDREWRVSPERRRRCLDLGRRYERLWQSRRSSRAS